MKAGYIWHFNCILLWNVGTFMDCKSGKAQDKKIKV